MKIQGGFLSNRAGRRIFWTLLLAAAVPIAVFGVAMHHLLSEQFQSQMARQQVQLVKFAGMGLLDRLLVARTALAIVTRTGRAESEPDPGSRNGRVLLEVAQLDARGRVLSGSTPLAQRWQVRTQSWLSKTPAEAATLLLGAEPDGAPERTVLMVVRDDAQRDRAWIAEVESGFLFGELSQAASGARICVFDSGRRPVHCPGWRPEDARQAAAAHAVQWRLFLRSDFAIDDWVLAAMDGDAAQPRSDAPMARVAALAAAVTLLFVGMLALVQVRRTMVPLEMLIAGTRRLSERDYGARVHLQQRDEFGELARSFNHMAERIDHQMHAMQVQSSIDQEILNGLDVSRVLQKVAERIERVVPSASAWVIEFDRLQPEALARVHRAGAPMILVNAARAETVTRVHAPASALVPWDPPPRWLEDLHPQASARFWLCEAQAGHDTLALLVLGGADGLVVDDEARREIAELCGRVSVALASADRERRLVERASCDSLTGLANRHALYESIDTMCTGAGTARFSVLFLDLDRFKEVNDSLGHHVGDQLLRAVARRLERLAPAGSLVARPGGDEFVLVIQGARASADALASAVRDEFARPIQLEGRAVSIGTSIGIAQFPEHGATALDLMRRADLAMFTAKARRDGGIAGFDASMEARVAERATLLAELRLALQRQEFELHYQPRIHTRSDSVKCAEALLRWRSPQRGLVPPDAFIPLLEDTGLIDEIGLWVLNQAASQLRQWRQQGVGLEWVAVNLSTRQLESAQFPAQVAAILARHALQPSDLEFEVTESIFMDGRSAAMRVLHQLHDSGIRIALDDFGTGYSSLSYLHTLPIGVIKVDRSFVSELGQRESALALTRSIVALARALGLSVVAEGVETEDQLDILTGLGCDELQGWLYAPALAPVPFAAFMQQPLRTRVTA